MDKTLIQTYMTEFDPINLIDRMITRVKKQGDVSAWKKDRKVSPLLTVISKLEKMPRANLPVDGLARVKNQVFNKISDLAQQPELTEARTNFFITITQVIPRSLKITGGIIAGLLIFVSLGAGVSVAALDSVPGQPLYAVKKAVEKTQLGLASEEKETELQIKFANNRLEELEKVLTKNDEGKLSEKATQRIVSQTVKDLQTSTKAAVAATEPEASKKKTIATLARIAELSTKQEAALKSASIRSDGEIKLELEKALEVSRISKEEAIANIERAGLKVEGQPVILEVIDEEAPEEKANPEEKPTETQTETELEIEIQEPTETSESL